MANPEVEASIPDRWTPVVAALRPILLGAGLTEAIKWGKPCYSHRGKNVVIVQAMKDFVALMFFKGALLDDPEGVLEDQGPNSRSARRVRFSTVDDVVRLTDTLTKYLGEAIAVEDSGVRVGAAPELVLVAELQHRLDQDPALAAAFRALTPGRQREYNLYFSGAKQAKTREARIDRLAVRIKDGKGLRDR